MRKVGVRLDRELDRAVANFAKQNDLTISQAIRDLLRQILTDAQPVTRGWREGFAKGCAEVHEKHHRSIGKVAQR